VSAFQFKLENPRCVRDFQAQWEPGLFQELDALLENALAYGFLPSPKLRPKPAT
jgi:hypothetical protein